MTDRTSVLIWIQIFTVFLKSFFLKDNIEKVSRRQRIHEKLPRVQRVKKQENLKIYKRWYFKVVVFINDLKPLAGSKFGIPVEHKLQPICHNDCFISLLVSHTPMDANDLKISQCKLRADQKIH